MSSGIYNKHTGYHNRHSLRLRGYDYSRPGSYFVTICINNPLERPFGAVTSGKMVENSNAYIVRACWEDLPNHYPYVELDEFVIMPNHVHGIIVLHDPGPIVGAGLKPAPTIGISPAPTIDKQTNPKPHGLPEIVRALKTFSSRRINESGHTFKWQRGYFDRIVRDEKALYFIRKYIRENPLHWNIDSGNHLNREIQEFDSTGFDGNHDMTK
jgi:putative transposase